MIKPLNLIGFILISISAFGLFQIKFYVQNLRKNLNELNKQIEQEKENIHVLKAEWAYLNQPERLRKIIDKHLQLTPAKASQIHKLQNNLPVILSEIDNTEEEQILSNFEEKNDKRSKMSSNKVKLVKGKIDKKYKTKISKVKL